ncbi:FAD-binding and (Fe-S)-binding domain-containing protein [Actinacidiphila acidipaludis]|uniref:D-lactate dehydrogenase (cytochrome) n=1 Tax=Actinacidiphila acidipaludis TaxID=2873382 RepID=A0ABS7Q8G4_9ACTN|nr:FAD-binding and (Fe-S)-binding domain-containing protein [Streptomyces acidipaludis]MBY8879243.1 FAD-binding oxidoreductase [Streptomyces acidipaludis]
MPVRERKKEGKGAGALRPSARADAAADRVEEARAGGSPAGLRSELAELLGQDKVLGRVADLVAHASDASPYRFVPQAVVVPDSVQDVVKLMAYARRQRRHLVFRAAGTSLHGQAQGEDILVDVRRHFSGVEVEAGGVRARILPGTVLARANAALARHGRVLGPDPASATAATVGGVLAGNASGAAAGTTRDSYHTVSSLTVVLPSGTVVDTGDPDADAALAAAEPELYQGLLDLRDEIEADQKLTARIRAKHAVKNTAGYRLDAFLDGETPVQILRGLMIGSQGTLGFVSEAVYDTLPLRPSVTAGLLFFPSLPAACAAVRQFAQAGADTVELMDGHALRACVGVPDVPAEWAGLPAECAALLVEFRAADDVELAAYERAARRICDDLGLVSPVPSADNAFTREPARLTAMWRARTAFAAAAGASRPPGTTPVVQDFAVPPDRLGEAATELLALQERHGFSPGLAGRAAHGTLHFLLSFDPGQAADLERYAAFTDELCALVTDRFHGSLRAEQGTGRAAAPFLEREWGAPAAALMWRVKTLLDPDGILAPRVVLDQDPRGHLRGLKSLPAIEGAAGACTECGLCEAVCPSRDLTTTPRQRIVLRREMLRQPAGSPVLEELLDAYGHDAVDTCAGDSLCAAACPAGIDTGALMLEFRSSRRTRAEERAAARLAVYGRAAERALRAALTAASALRGRAGDRPLTAVAAVLRRAAGTELIPGWLPETPVAAPRLPRTAQHSATAVYYPACANRVFGPPRGAGWAPQALVAVSERAGMPVWIPPDVTGTCCAAPWHAKGYTEGAVLMANRIVEQTWMWTGGGRLPVVVDAGACTLGLSRDVVPYLTEANRELHGELTVIDSVVWAAEHLLPRLTVTSQAASAVLHPTCAMRRLGQGDGGAGDALDAVARACAAEVVTPGDAGCCAFAGGRGTAREDLTGAATRREAEEVAGRDWELHLSADRMCELAMEHATGEPYEPVLAALERATRVLPEPDVPAEPATAGEPPRPGESREADGPWEREASAEPEPPGGRQAGDSGGS